MYIKNYHNLLITILVFLSFQIIFVIIFELYLSFQLFYEKEIILIGHTSFMEQRF